jgi:hypothetical protein
MMWNDPWLDMQLHQLDYEHRLNATAWRWQMHGNSTPPAEPIPLRDWLALLGEMLIVIGSWLKREQYYNVDSGYKPEAQSYETGVLPSYSLYRPSDSSPTFSLN